MNTALTFVEALMKEMEFTRTDNNAVALRSTGSAVLDLFATGGAMRDWDEREIARKFTLAAVENLLLTMRCAFYIRDIRGGQGERDIFRTGLQVLATLYPEAIMKNIPHIPEYGRWDDLYALRGTRAEKAMWDFVRKSWDADVKALEKREPISLMGKWLASADASSKETVDNAKATMKALGLTPKQYRQTLSKLRKKLDIVERHLCGGTVSEINYEAVPSRAAMIYRNAFLRKDEERYSAYLKAVQEGKASIKASTLYPYDILEKMSGGYFFLGNVEYDPVLEAQWKALPNYVDSDETNNVLVMADTSASMNGRPMATSVGVAIYFAERNSGPFAKQFLTFSSRPELVTIVGETLYEKLNSFRPIVENTDLEAAFRLILDVALRNGIDQSEMPKSIVVISDMQFDQGVENADDHKTLYESMSETYRKHGYEIPNVVFWNVASPRDTFQVRSDLPGVQLVSGQSPAVFKTVLSCIGRTPYQAMLDTLNSPRYERIVI